MQSFKNYSILIGIMLTGYFGFSQVSISQSVISSTGNFSSTSSTNYSSTAGEVVVSTQTAGSYALTQGFHQPISGGTSTATQQYSDANFSVSVFPNPTTNLFSIEITLDKEIDLEIEVIDILGKNCGTIIQLSQLSGHSLYQCELNNFASGLYFVKVSSKETLYNKTIRIQKID